MRKPYDPIADEEPHIVAEYHFPNCTAYIADNYLRRLTPEQKEANRQAPAAWRGRSSSGPQPKGVCPRPAIKRAARRVHRSRYYGEGKDLHPDAGCAGAA